ncbi:hypothetical protein MSAN_00243800 [Mycena sanguinolenta]|uniref:F-box domain-containing protein n=1 Tax=Mycena sanguinolenta TaxID=230812 RepID=A0A8H7DLS4_9AGAR|nr:hypothetical protein MSAN_00243800 [Mycena sanguinolenta]
MVLTRRAARELNSIVRWLPNEILSAVMSYSSKSDLLVLCRTSRLMHNIATRLLYHTVSLATGAQMEAFLRTMELIQCNTDSSPSLFDHVRQFVIKDQKCTANLSTRAVELLASVISQFRYLESLDLLLEKTIEFAEVLDQAYFKKSLGVAIHCSIAKSALLSESSSDDNPFDSPFQTILSPFFNAASIRSVLSTCVMSSRDDLEIQTALLLLTTTTELSTLAVAVQYNINVSAFLEAVTRHIPRIEVVVLRRGNLGATQISKEDILEIATSLEKLSHLRIFDLGINVGEEYDDLETIKIWSGACKSLFSIVLRTLIPAAAVIALIEIGRWKSLGVLERSMDKLCTSASESRITLAVPAL